MRSEQLQLIYDSLYACERALDRALNKCPVDPDEAEVAMELVLRVIKSESERLDFMMQALRQTEGN
jgi:hypothetical protein